MSLANAAPLVLVGAGKMGTALARGWLDAGLPASALTMVDPEPAEPVVAFARETGAALVETVPDMAARVMVMAVKPQVFSSVAGMCRSAVDEGTIVLSIAAGISVAAMEAAFGTGRVVRTMPNTPAQVGKGVAGLVAGSRLSPEDREIAGALLEAVGTAVWLADESQIDAVTAVSGSGPAYVFHLVEALAAAGEAQGLDAERAMALARQTVVGAAALMEAEPAAAAVLRQNVTSPGGTTAAALEVLMDEASGLSPLIARAVHAARVRSEELGQ